MTAADVEVKNPGRGLQPHQRDALLGVTLHRDVPSGDFFYAGDLAGRPQARSDYSFHRPWGLPVWFHDFRALLEVSEPDFLEFHQSAKDMELDLGQFFDSGEKLDQFFTVHAPDLYPGDFRVHLASPDEEIWERSIREVQRVVDLTRDLRKHFTCDEDPIVIITMGGFLPDRHLRPEERYPLYERVQQGLERVDEEGVRLTAQTLPPFPWLMGGQQFHNLFVEPEDTVWFCETYDRRLTLDVSHSKLAANFYQRPFSEYLEAMGSHTEHLHIVDSVGVDGEGVQVGEGRSTSRTSPSAWTASHRPLRSSPRSGWATSTTAKGSSRPWIGCGNGSDRGRRGGAGAAAARAVVRPRRRPRRRGTPRSRRAASRNNRVAHRRALPGGGARRAVASAGCTSTHGPGLPDRRCGSGDAGDTAHAQAPAT